MAVTCTATAHKKAGKDCVNPTEAATTPVDGFFLSGTGDAAVFAACHASCKTCTGATADKCLSCNAITGATAPAEGAENF